MKFIKKPMILASIYLIISFATLSYFFFMSYQLVEEKQKEVLLVELENTSKEINEEFIEIDTIIKTLESYLSLDTNDGELLDLLVTIDQKYESIASIYLGKTDKSMVNSSGFVPGPDFDLRTRIWYSSAIASEGTIFTPAFINASKDRVIVTAAKAIYDQNTLIGVLAVDIDIRTIAAFVSEKEIGDNGYAILIDSNNHLLAYPGMDLSIVDLKDVSDFEENLLVVGDVGTYEDFYISDEQGVLSVGEIESNNYQLLVFLPQSEFALSLIFISRMFVFLGLIMLVIAAIVLLIYNFRVRKPLDLLLRDIDQIDVSKTIDYRLPKLHKDDYDHIRNALNKVLEATDLFFQEKQDAQHQLSIENQRVRLLMESATDIIFEIDKDRRYVSIFGRGLNLLQLKASDFLGKTVVEIFGEKSIERDRIYEDALKGKHRVYDWEYQIDGLSLYFESSISPIYDESKNIIGAVGITRDITEPMQKQKEIEYISIHDFLTGIYNRRYFVEAFMKFDHPNYYPLGLMMVDLNGLKILNDAYGHDKGDIALKEVARVLNEETQKEDIVCRIGGDEFAIIFKNTQVLILDKIKENIGRKLSQVFVENIPLSVAVGYEIKMNEVRTFEEIMKNAENQMYRNKLTEGKSIRNNSIKAILKTLTDKFEEEKIHSERVSHYCRLIGQKLNIKTADLNELEIAGLFHDIGKISIPDHILHKKSFLSKEDYEIIKTHTENGYNILRAADKYSNLAEYALTHHEHWNGLGYPRGLSKEEIPLFSRIIAIADAYEAMTSDRVYRKAMSQEDAVREIIRCSGSQFDPFIARIFVEEVLGFDFDSDMS